MSQRRIPYAIVAACGALSFLHTSAAGQQLPPHVRAVKAGAPPGQVTELWIAQGAYSPWYNGTCHAYVLDGLSMYGGFAGNEHSISERPSGAHSGLVDSCDPNGFAINVNTASEVVVDGFEIRALRGIDIIGPARLENVQVTLSNREALRKLDTAPFIMRNSVVDANSLNSWVVELRGPGTIEACHFDLGGSFARGAWLRDLSIRDCFFLIGTDQAGLDADGVNFQHCTINAGSFKAVGIHLSTGSFYACDLRGGSSHPGTDAIRLQDVQVHRTDFRSYGSSFGTGMALLATAIKSSRTLARLEGSNTIANTLFTGTASRYGIRGETAQADFINCTFQHGRTIGHDPTWRAFHIGPNWRFENCIIWNQTYPANLTFSAPPGLTNFINHSIVRGWDAQWAKLYGGIGNSGANPLLNPDGSLQPGSPAIDAGNTAALPTISPATQTPIAAPAPPSSTSPTSPPSSSASPPPTPTPTATSPPRPRC
jgi:hypothetical protein